MATECSSAPDSENNSKKTNKKMKHRSDKKTEAINIHQMLQMIPYLHS